MPAKILIVDDEPNLLRMLGYAFHKEGYEVIVGQNGVEGLHKSLHEKPDLVILDVMMPDMDGLEVCRRIRSNLETKNLPIIMLSARSQVSDKIEGLQAGADEYVTKPVEMTEMIARVQALLARTRRLQETKQLSTPGKVLGVVGAKGGVGATTLALNLAAGLAKLEHKVIAAELRSYYGTFSAQLRWEPADTIGSLLELEPEYINRRELDRRLLETAFGVKLLFGPQINEGVRSFRTGQAQAIVKGLVEMTDFLLLDLPSYPTDASEAAAKECDYIMVVVEPEPVSLFAGSVMLNLLNDWGIGAGRLGVVVVNRAASASTMNLSDIRSQLGFEILGLVPPMADACLLAQRQARPVVLVQPDILASQNLMDMTRRLTEGRVVPLAI